MRTTPGLFWATRTPVMLGSSGLIFPTHSLMAGFKSKPSMSMAKRGGEGTKVYLVLRATSDSKVTRE